LICTLPGPLQEDPPTPRSPPLRTPPLSASEFWIPICFSSNLFSFRRFSTLVEGWVNLGAIFFFRSPRSPQKSPPFLFSTSRKDPHRRKASEAPLWPNEGPLSLLVFPFRIQKMKRQRFPRPPWKPVHPYLKYWQDHVVPSRLLSLVFLVLYIFFSFSPPPVAPSDETFFSPELRQFAPPFLFTPQVIPCRAMRSFAPQFTHLFSFFAPFP